MPIIFVLIAVIVIAAVYLVYSSRTPEENKKMDSFLGKVKGAMATKPATEQSNEAATERYEKSDDGKVVYAFKREDKTAPQAEAEAATESAETQMDAESAEAPGAAGAAQQAAAEEPSKEI